MESGDKHANMKVVVRVRPNSRRELEQNQISIIQILDETTLLFDPDEDDEEFFFQGIKQGHRDITKKVHKKLSMEFDHVFNSDTTNDQIFCDCTKPLVQSVMNGYNCSVFVYGATGAGKTFTMLGAENIPGITYLTMQELFRKINELEETRKFDIGISYLEVYNEQVMNLLTRTGPLTLREDGNGNVVSGLALKPIYNAEELLELLALGNRNRTQHPTDANAESSRSHAIFQVHIRMTEKKTGQKRTVKLSMIDLAGSERAASTKGIGIRFKEGASINKSLLSLGNCINKLADGLKHIPYRDSKLTRILKDSLGGNCQTIMIANVSPSSLTYEDTYNTLKYASRAKKIRSTVRQNVLKDNKPKDYYVKKVTDQMDEIFKLREMLKNLQQQKPHSFEQENRGSEENDLKSWHNKIDAIYGSLQTSQESFMNLLSKEKILRIRIELKSHLEEAKKILILDAYKNNEDIGRFHATIDRYHKAIIKQAEDLNRWRKRYLGNLNETEKLNKDILQDNNKYQNLLQIYLKYKESETQKLKREFQIKHINKINNLQHIHIQHLHKTHKLSLEINQSNYYSMRSNKLVDSDYQENLNKLNKMLNGHGIQFFDETQDSNENQSELMSYNLDDEFIKSECTNININGKRLHTNDNEHDDNHKTIKSNRKLFKDSNNLNDVNDIYSNNTDLNADNEFNDFKHPGDNLNAKHILNSDINTTFSIDNMKLGKNDKEVMQNIITEHSVKAPNREFISKALLKSNVTRQNILKSINQGIVNKENKYNSGKIRKSPRGTVKTVSRVLNSAATTFLQRQRSKTEKAQTSSTSAQTPTSDKPGIVRINRSATLRTNMKK